MSSQSVPKATLFTYPRSLWASVPALGLIEKGYAETDYNLKTVDLMKGENFSTEFLRINPKGTLPVLVVPLINEEPDHPQKYKSITDSVAILEFLDVSRKALVHQPTTANGNSNPAPSLSPAIISAKFEADQLIELVHDEARDMNKLMIGCLDEADLKAKKATGTLGYLKGKVEALSKNLADQSDEVTKATKAFWEDRLKSSKVTLEIYEGQASKETKQEFFKQTAEIWANSLKFLITLDKTITSHGGNFILGEQISLPDLHVGPWLARMMTNLGGKTVDEEPALEEKIKKLLTKLDSKADFELDELKKALPGIESYWNMLRQRPSFQKVYAKALH